MTQLFNIEADTEYEELEWATDEMNWNDFEQVADSYVRHAHGFLRGNQLWVDPNGVIGSSEEFRDFAEEYYPDVLKDAEVDDILFDINGSEDIVVKSPGFEHVDSENKGRLVLLMEELGVHDRVNIVWAYEEESDSERIPHRQMIF